MNSVHWLKKQKDGGVTQHNIWRSIVSLTEINQMYQHLYKWLVLMERMQKDSRIIQNEFSKWTTQKGIYILFYDLTAKLHKLRSGIAMHGKNLSKSFKFTRPTWLSFIRAIWISSNHSAMWCIITFLAFEHEHQKIWESISKMLKPHREVLTHAPSTNKPANRWLKCSSLWQNLGPKTTWIETNFSALNLSPEHLYLYSHHTSC